MIFERFWMMFEWLFLRNWNFHDFSMIFEWFLNMFFTNHSTISQKSLEKQTIKNHWQIIRKSFGFSIEFKSFHKSIPFLNMPPKNHANSKHSFQKNRLKFKNIASENSILICSCVFFLWFCWFFIFICLDFGTSKSAKIRIRIEIRRNFDGISIEFRWNFN